LNKTNSTFKWLIAISLISSIFISIYIVKRLNNPVNQLLSILDKPLRTSNSNLSMKNMANLDHLLDGIQLLVNENFSYSQELESKDSVLEKLSYQAGIKNIYPDISKRLDIKNDYCLLYFKSHFKSTYYENILPDNALALYYLTEIIQFYVNIYFADAVTFHVESDSIVSVVNIHEDVEIIKDRVDLIVEKLKNEEEYIFFTIVYSTIYQDI